MEQTTKQTTKQTTITMKQDTTTKHTTTKQTTMKNIILCIAILVITIGGLHAQNTIVTIPSYELRAAAILSADTNNDGEVSMDELWETESYIIDLELGEDGATYSHEVLSKMKDITPTPENKDALAGIEEFYGTLKLRLKGEAAFKVNDVDFSKIYANIIELDIAPKVSGETSLNFDGSYAEKIMVTGNTQKEFVLANGGVIESQLSELVLKDISFVEGTVMDFSATAIKKITLNNVQGVSCVILGKHQFGLVGKSINSVQGNTVFKLDYCNSGDDIEYDGDFKKGLTVYPNPSNGLFKIAFVPEEGEVVQSLQRYDHMYKQMGKKIEFTKNDNSIYEKEFDYRGILKEYRHPIRISIVITTNKRTYMERVLWGK